MQHQPQGHLVVVGGGRLPPEVFRKALAVAGGDEARVLIIPQASLWSGAGQRIAQMWKLAGARKVTVLDLEDHEAALKAIKEADLIWIGGGNQARLMSLLKQNGLVTAIRDRFRAGATVGGTSAGAAVMSQIMLIASRGRNGIWIPHETVGLGLWPDVIVDQHFLRRHRLLRLRDAVLHHPDKPGVGIDEGTAVVVEGRHFEVLGRSKVLVLDARHEKKAASKVETFVLDPGMKFDLDRGIVSGR